MQRGMIRLLAGLAAVLSVCRLGVLALELEAATRQRNRLCAAIEALEQETHHLECELQKVRFPEEYAGKLGYVFPEDIVFYDGE